jgi:4-carboxymuconolactone decarboxylase
VTDNAYGAGIELRHAMFGKDVTDRQIENANQFTRAMQDVVSKYCFGETWSRDGLSLRDRSMATLAALCAMGRSHELKIHVKGAIANGVTPLEIRELLLHTMVYAGVPLGVNGILSAAESLAEEGVDLNNVE